MPRKIFPVEIQIIDRIKHRKILIGLEPGMFKKLMVTSIESNSKSKTKKQTISTITQIKKALNNKITNYTKTLTVNL